MATVLQASDLQYGRPYRPAVGDAFVRLARTLEPDLVVVAGDLTQRARASEFRGVLDLLAGLPDVPVVLTPGNHDVPLYRVWERLLDPYRNWRRFVSPDRDTVTRVPGVTVVALDSSAPRRAVVAGHLTAAQVRWAAARFAEAPRKDARLLVTHHHFVVTEDRLGGRPLSGAADLLRAFEGMGVDAILGGHVHQTHFRSSRSLVPGVPDEPGIALLACGTTASARGRGPEEGRNTLNVVRVGSGALEVTPHEYAEKEGAFVASAPRVFLRRTPVPAVRSET